MFDHKFSSAWGREEGPFIVKQWSLQNSSMEVGYDSRIKKITVSLVASLHHVNSRFRYPTVRFNRSSIGFPPDPSIARGYHSPWNLLQNIARCWSAIAADGCFLCRDDGKVRAAHFGNLGGLYVPTDGQRIGLGSQAIQFIILDHWRGVYIFAWQAYDFDCRRNDRFRLLSISAFCRASQPFFSAWSDDGDVAGYFHLCPLSVGRKTKLEMDCDNGCSGRISNSNQAGGGLYRGGGCGCCGVIHPWIIEKPAARRGLGDASLNGNPFVRLLFSPRAQWCRWLYCQLDDCLIPFDHRTGFLCPLA